MEQPGEMWGQYVCIDNDFTNNNSAMYSRFVTPQQINSPTYNTGYMPMINEEEEIYNNNKKIDDTYNAFSLSSFGNVCLYLLNLYIFVNKYYTTKLN